MAEQAADLGKAAAMDATKAGATVAKKTANFAMSDEGRAIITDGVKNGVALGTAVATGNTVGAVIGGAKLAKDGL